MFETPSEKNIDSKPSEYLIVTLNRSKKKSFAATFRSHTQRSNVGCIPVGKGYSFTPETSTVIWQASLRFFLMESFQVPACTYRLYPLVICYVALENGSLTVDLPIKMILPMVISHSKLLVYQYLSNPLHLIAVSSLRAMAANLASRRQNCSCRNVRGSLPDLRVNGRYNWYDMVWPIKQIA